jgi:hypothetical protein
MSYTCEKCGKVTEEKFGSGRFCSRACANTRTHSAETKERISRGIQKQNICFCQFCGKEFNTLTAKASHERLCESNSNKLDNPSTQHLQKLQRNVVLHRYGEDKKGKAILDITYSELEQYRATHPVCEICGRTMSESLKWESKYAAKELCVDHDHTTNKFRGLLCHNCNTRLGWYENHKEAIQKYLDK